MRRSLIPAAVSALLFASLFAPPSGATDRGTVPAQARRPQKVAYQQRGSFVPGELLVKFRSGVSRARQHAVHGVLAARVAQRIGGLDVQRVRLPRGVDVRQAVRRYQSDPAVEYAEPNYYRFPAFTPNDTSYGNLWAMNNQNPPQQHPISDPPPPTAAGTADADMDVAEAWDNEKGDPSAVVGVLDSGVDVSHPDLAGNLWVNPGENCGSTDPTISCAQRTDGLDNDSNHCEDDVFGCDFTKSPPSGASLLEPNPLIAGREHGTHVAGTIAGVTNNAAGISGVCGGDAGATEKGCGIMVLKFMEPVDTDGDMVPDSMAGPLGAELAGITYARVMGADIVNGSFGAPGFANSERGAIQTAGSILFVFAASNDSLDNDVAMCLTPSGPCSPSYPVSYNLTHILSVAASNHHDEYGYFTGCASPSQGFTKPQCAFTNFGRYSVDVAAPGVDILSTVISPNYATFNGTSMAAPHAAGVAGLLESQNPTRSATTLKSIIMATADTSNDSVAQLPLNNSMNTAMFTTQRTGQFTRTSARVNANDAVDFVGTPPNGSANHDGDIPGAAGMSKAKVGGSLGWPADVNDVRKKKLTKGNTYKFTLVVPGGRDFDLYLVKFDAKEIWQPGKGLRRSIRGTGADESFTYKPGVTKSFFIHMTWFSGATGNYTLKVVCIRSC